MSSRHGLKARVCGPSLSAGGAQRLIVDACVAADMRGSGPHDLVCELRSGGRALESSVAFLGRLIADPRVARERLLHLITDQVPAYFIRHAIDEFAMRLIRGALQAALHQADRSAAD